jgi:hypothetical protein
MVRVFVPHSGEKSKYFHNDRFIITLNPKFKPYKVIGAKHSFLRKPPKLGDWVRP